MATELGMSSAFAIETARIGQGEKMKNSQTWVRAGDHLEGSPAPQTTRPQEDVVENKCAFLTVNHDLQELCGLVVSCGELW